MVGKFGGDYHYDILVVALGFKPNFFGIPGAKEHTYKLTSLNAALKLGKHIEWQFKDYHIDKDPLNLSFIVCGAGFTSIEFVAELATNSKKICQIYGLDPKNVKITCIGRSERILPIFSPDLSAKTQKFLENLGVTFMNNTKVVECIKHGVVVQDANGEIKVIECKTVLWSAGVKGNDTIEHYSKINSIDGKISVDGQLKSTDFDNIYVVGDCATSKREVKFVPTAQIATQMGEYVGHLLADKLEGKNNKADFKFINRGSICSLGHLDAIGYVFGRKVNGEIGAFMKNLIENRWLFGIGGLKMVIKKGQFRYRSSD